MIRILTCLPLVLTLAACGVDGAPVPPSEVEEPETGLVISGTVEVGVSSRRTR